jgi:hypothetical protein
MGEYVMYDSEWEARFEREGEATHLLFSKGDYAWHVEYRRHLEEVNVTITLSYTGYEVAKISVRIIGDPYMSDLWFSDMQEFRKTLDIHGARKALQYILDTVMDYFRRW